MKDYKVLLSDSTITLSKHVFESFKNDWICQGGVSFCPILKMYMQAMIKTI